MDITQGQTFAITKWDQCDTGFYSVQTTYLTIKILTFAKNENIQF